MQLCSRSYIYINSPKAGCKVRWEQIKETAVMNGIIIYYVYENTPGRALKVVNRVIPPE